MRFSRDLRRLFEYKLPSHLIAQRPVLERDSSRLMVVRRREGRISHHRFWELPEFLGGGDCLVRNNTKVEPVRLFARKRSGGRVELLLLRCLSSSSRGLLYEALVRGRRISLPQELVLEGVEVVVRVLSREGLTYRVEFPGELDLEGIFSQVGYMPLPPYIRRDYTQLPDREDFERYQTVYASRPGSSAAPTAGLHFTSEVFRRLEVRGVRILDITLHVGLGTFAPIRGEVEEHRMHRERFEVPLEVFQVLRGLDRSRHRILAVGTTTLRALEAVWQTGDLSGETDLFIYPPYEVRSVDLLLTNFHLPRSTLILLVAAFGGEELIYRAYQEAIAEGYRFYSYGDAMLIL